VSSWRAEDIPTEEGAARVLAADATLQRRYRRPDGAEVWVFIAYFEQQQVNSQIHSPRHCVPGGGLTVSFVRPEQLRINDRLRPVTRMRVLGGGRPQDVLYWFTTRGGTTSGEYALKWDLVKNSLAGRPTDAFFVRYNASTADSSALYQVMSLLDGPLQRVMEEVGLQ
jgi:EpsI family protein